MVLTFTGSLSVATAGRDDVREMFLGALGCNFVWGIIDALLFLMQSITERGHNAVLLRRLRGCDATQGRTMVLDALPEGFALLLEPEHIEHLRKQLVERGTAKLGATVSIQDLRAALSIFAIVFISTFPVLIPFLVMHDAWHALRVSNAIAIGMLVASGIALARYTGGRATIWGIVVAAIGIAIVLLTIALGG